MRNPIVAMVSAAWFIALSLAANAATLYVECESFSELGGWVVDPHSMKALGSSYVMAHGIGKPVADAKTTVAVPSADSWRLWRSCRDGGGGLQEERLYTARRL
jgi:hypothetical protein